MESIFSYSFPALKGLQAGREYYIVMCPLRLIPKIFLFDEEEVPPEHRAQRILNKSRIPDITNYVLENPKDYVFSSLTVSVDGEISFTPFSTDQQFKNIGSLKISLDSKFLINDGQHRRAAIEEALKISPELGNETISVVFFHDQGLRKSQQIFADLNRHAVNTTSSIGILYEHRDSIAVITKEIVNETPLLNRYTDKEKVSLSSNSPKLFVLSHIYNTNAKILGKKKGDLITPQETLFLHEFWSTLTESIDEWKQLFNKQITPRELRVNYIIAHGVFIEAMGLIGHYLFRHHLTDWKDYLSNLNHIDWTRSNKKDWMGRAYGKTGRINKNNQTLQLTANKIKQKLGLPLTEVEQRIEDLFVAEE